MSTIFDRPVYGFRFVDTFVGDTLQNVAARELGDAGRWPELISHNRLVPPFLVDDPVLVRPGVLLTGTQILVPAPSRVAVSTDPDEVFGSDLALGQRGELLTDGFDFVVSSGRNNLKQAIRNRIVTERGDLMFHPEYGCDVRRRIGFVNGPTKGLLSAQAAKAAVQQDARIDRVTKAVATVGGDVINISIEAEPVAGQPVLASVSI